MSLLSKILAFLRSLFGIYSTRDLALDRTQRFGSTIVFPSITFIDKPPRNEDITPEQFYCIKDSTTYKWSLFKCPCGCDSVITLSLQQIHQPYWHLTRTAAGRPTLKPSVWRDKGCFSHFWLRDGRVLWCFNTGTHPDLWRSC